VLILSALLGVFGVSSSSLSVLVEVVGELFLNIRDWSCIQSLRFIIVIPGRFRSLDV
jgi:hypothetical protein